MKGTGHVDHMANSIYTAKGESWGAGRLYDHIGKKVKGTVKLANYYKLYYTSYIGAIILLLHFIKAKTNDCKTQM